MAHARFHRDHAYENKSLWDLTPCPLQEMAPVEGIDAKKRLEGARYTADLRFRKLGHIWVSFERCPEILLCSMCVYNSFAL